MDKFDPLEWAKNVKPRVTHKCQTCEIKEVMDATRVILQLQAEGKIKHVSVAMMWGKWKEQYKYPFAYTTFKGHVVKCEKELWRIIRGEKPKAKKEANTGTSDRR